MIRKIVLSWTLIGTTVCSVSGSFQQSLQQTAFHSASSSLQRHWKSVAGTTLGAVGLFGLASYGYIAGYGLDQSKKDAWNSAWENRLKHLSYTKRITNLGSLLTLRYLLSSQKEQDLDPWLNETINNRWPSLPGGTTSLTSIPSQSKLAMPEQRIQHTPAPAPAQRPQTVQEVYESLDKPKQILWRRILNTGLFNGASEEKKLATIVEIKDSDPHKVVNGYRHFGVMPKEDTPLYNSLMYYAYPCKETEERYAEELSKSKAKKDAKRTLQKSDRSRIVPIIHTKPLPS